MCWSFALIWSADHAGANCHLLTYTCWPWHTGLFSITSPEIRLQLSFLFVARGAAWLHLHQVPAIMCDWWKGQKLIFPTVLMGLRAQTSVAKLFTQSHYLCFLISCVEHWNHNITYLSDFLSSSLNLRFDLFKILRPTSSLLTKIIYIDTTMREKI